VRTILLLLLSLAAIPSSQAIAQAKTDQCKICRDYNAACVKAHSKEACGSELKVCLKHCRETK